MTPKRVTVIKKSANPLFDKWLSEWRDQAKENNSKMQYTFNNALKILRKYPLPLESGKDCIILKGFGNTLCRMLDKKLSEHKANNEHLNIDRGNKQNESNSNDKNKQIKINKTPKTNKTRKSDSKSPKTKKSYQPARRSGAYAILITLLKKSQEINYSGSLTKDEIIEHGRFLCDKSFTKPDPGTFYTSWSSMSTLISKGYVLRKGSPFKYSLTDEGEILALKLIEIEDSTTSENDLNKFVEQSDILNTNNERNDLGEDIVSSNNDPVIIDCDELQSSDSLSNINKYNATNKCSEYREINTFSSSSFKNPTTQYSDTDTVTSSQTSTIADTVIFAPKTFDVILLVDTQETTGGTRKPSDDETISELQHLNVNFEVRHLKVGDFTWICRERTTKEELILPYIAERKRMDDLGHSIKDGRFHEQKFRLKQCGIQNLIYIVESFGNNTRTVLPLSSLMQGATNTLIQENFQVKFTENHRHSMQYLSGFTLMLKHIYEEKTVMSCPKENLSQSNIKDDLISLMTFKEFNKGASKSKKLKVKDVFVRQLLQLKGVSVEKALAIVEKYSTPKLLKLEYNRLGAQGEKLLSTIPYGPLKKAVGPVISKSIYQLYTTNKLV